jgi:N-acetylmuramic acid 6-phosphate etherase
VEGAEDSEADGAAAIETRGVQPCDVVFGIATGGTTPFVHGALRRARQLDAKTVFLACVPKDQVADEADISIRVITGAEVLTGSTRLKAGTATKMVLNMVTTISMARIGKVYGNLMIDVNTAANAKLIDRGTRIIETITGLSRDESQGLLKRAGGHVKTAIVMHKRCVDQVTAAALIENSGGSLADAMGGR